MNYMCILYLLYVCKCMCMYVYICIYVCINVLVNKEDLFALLCPFSTTICNAYRQYCKPIHVSHIERSIVVCMYLYVYVCIY